ncbi:Gfo/Idh/MocA family oxidoreductase [Bacillus coahuilensis]|uniref:Gfo/Idh/MocA family oxidoreductase n=1 Tax=Bacillus coahuilensis TaxID=408580 RepID=UPI00018513E8
MTNISVGIIGSGSMAEHRHAPEYAEHRHAPEYAAHHQVGEIVFYDRNQDRAERLANKFKGRSVHRIEDLFNDPRIHLISDCSSNETHMFNTIEALNKGKHVLCEKPMANTIEEAKAMVEASKKTGKRLFIAHNQRFVRAHQRAKDIVDSGSLGKVLSFKTTFSHRGPEHWGTTKSNATWFFKKERSYSGVIGDMGIHKMDLLRYILSDEMEEVSAFGGAIHKQDENHEPIEVYDHVTSILRTKRGVLGGC